MHRGSILHAIPCDLKPLPIGALEVFVLSCSTGGTAEQVADSAGLEVEELLKLARRLFDLGALSVDGVKAKPKRHTPLRRTEYPSAPPPAAPPASLVPPDVAPVPRPCPDLRSLGIGPREGFILSQIDGVTTTADLLEITHLSAREVSDALRALEAAGAIDLAHGKRDARSTSGSKAPPSPATKATSSGSMKATRSGSMKASSRSTKAPPPRASKSPPPQAPTSPSLPPREPAPPAEQRRSEIPEADRVRIADDAERFDGLGHYEALGVERDADAKTIRRSYHALAAKFHPDRFFNKNLGSSRQALHRSFVRVTRAYEVLSKKITRDEYDATLPPRPLAPAPTPAPTPAPSPMPAIAQPPKVPDEPPRTSVRAPPSPRPPPPGPVVVAPASGAPRVAAPASDARPESASTRAAVPASDPKLRVTSGKTRTSAQEHVDVFVRAAKEAIERDDLVAAANHYRLAAQCTSDPSIRAALEETDAKARARVRDVSLTAARAAEQAGRWAEAAAKYVKAHGASAVPWIAERAANALRREGADLRRAAQLAEQAVAAEPNDVGYRVTLGEIYLDAGQTARAAVESARALALAPADPRAKALARILAKTKRA